MALSDYFNLDVDLAKLAKYWSSQDPHYSFVNQHIYGCRMLRQDPVECLFQFICSSNNHISRIHGMVNHLCRAYGTKMEISQGEPPHATPAWKCSAAVHMPCSCFIWCRCLQCTASCWVCTMVPPLALHTLRCR